MIQIGIAAVATAIGLSTAAPGVAAAEPPPPLPPGALVQKFWRNQIQNCEAICPYLLNLVVDPPVALLQAPGAYNGGLATTGSEPRARGIAAATVTGAANAAMTGIIDNDLNRVYPRAKNAFEVGAIELTNIQAALGNPSTPDRPSLQTVVETARTNFAAALDKPLTRNPAPIVVPANTAQEDLLKQIRIGSAVLFEAPEQALVGFTEAADIAAKSLVETGDFDVARVAGQTHIDATLATAAKAIDSALGGQTAVR